VFTLFLNQLLNLNLIMSLNNFDDLNEIDTTSLDKDLQDFLLKEQQKAQFQAQVIQFN
jgi:hypothetical protein